MAESEEYLEELMQNDAEEPQEQEQADEPQQAQEEGRANARIRELVEDRNELRDQVQDLERRLQTFSGLRQEIEELREAQKPKPEAPVFEQDPKAYIDHLAAENRRQLEERYEKTSKTTEETMQQAAAARFATEISSREQAFLQGHPDYYEALAYRRELKLQSLTDLGVNENQARQMLAQEEMGLAGAALQNQKDPAEAAYNDAVRMGYKKEAEKEPEQDADEERLNAAEAAQSMGSGGSGALRELMEAGSDDEFDQAFKELYGRDMG